MSESNELPKGWAEATFSELALYVTSGARDWSKYYSDTGVLFVRTEDINTNRLELSKTARMTLPVGVSPVRTRIERGDILVTVTGANVGRCAYVETDIEEAYPSQSVALVKLLDRTLAPYLHKALLSPIWGQRQLGGMAYGLGRPVLNLDNIRTLRLPIAPLPEQHRIVEKIEELFSDLDAGVASLERARANLKRYRASVLKSAVEGRLTQEWRKEHPQAEDGAMLLDRILRKRREKWEKDQLLKFKEKGKKPPKNWQSKYEEPSAPDTSELAELPEGWVWTSLEAVAFFQNGHAFPSKDYADEGVRLLRPGNLFDDGTVKWTDKNTRCLPEKWENECPGHIVGEHEVVMNLTAQSLKDNFLGRACLTGEGEKCLLNQRLARITPVASVASRYLLFLLKSRLFREFVKGLNTGSLIQHMFTSQLKDFVFPLPRLAEQEQIVALVEERLSQIDSAEKTIDRELIRSKRLRQSILKRAFEGKLVSQDLNDEPASVLLDRIKASREGEQTKKKAKKVKARAK